MSTPPESPSRDALRQVLRQRRQTLDAGFRAQAAQKLAAHARGLPGWQSAGLVGGYWPNDGEIDPLPLLSIAQQGGARICLPVLAPGNTLAFREWDGHSALTVNRFGIPEPPASAASVPLARLDILLMPLVGWREDGTRLGMGGGFYDRSLAISGGPVKVGMAFACQQTSAIQPQPWDIPLDYVLTETGLHDCSSRRRVDEP